MSPPSSKRRDRYRLCFFFIDYPLLTDEELKHSCFCNIFVLLFFSTGCVMLCYMLRVFLVFLCLDIRSVVFAFLVLNNSFKIFTAMMNIYSFINCTGVKQIPGIF